MLVLACSETSCRSLEGSRRAKARVREAMKVLEEIGLGSGRVMIKQGGVADRQEVIAALEELAAQIGESVKGPKF